MPAASLTTGCAMRADVRSGRGRVPQPGLRRRASRPRRGAAPRSRRRPSASHLGHGGLQDPARRLRSRRTAAAQGLHRAVLPGHPALPSRTACRADAGPTSCPTSGPRERRRSARSRSPCRETCLPLADCCGHPSPPPPYPVPRPPPDRRPLSLSRSRSAERRPSPLPPRRSSYFRPASRPSSRRRPRGPVIAARSDRHRRSNADGRPRCGLRSSATRAGRHCRHGGRTRRAGRRRGCRIDVARPANGRRDLPRGCRHHHVAAVSPITPRSSRQPPPCARTRAFAARTAVVTPATAATTRSGPGGPLALRSSRQPPPRSSEPDLVGRLAVRLSRQPPPRPTEPDPVGRFAVRSSRLPLPESSRR